MVCTAERQAEPPGGNSIHVAARFCRHISEGRDPPGPGLTPSLRKTARNVQHAEQLAAQM